MSSEASEVDGPWDAVIVLTPGCGPPEIRVTKPSLFEARDFARSAAVTAYMRDAGYSLEFYPAHRIQAVVVVPKGARVPDDHR